MLVEKDDKTMDQMTEEIRRDLAYMTYAPILFISAKTGQRVDKLFDMIDYVAESGRLPGHHRYAEYRSGGCHRPASSLPRTRAAA